MTDKKVAIGGFLKDLRLNREPIQTTPDGAFIMPIDFSGSMNEADIKLMGMHEALYHQTVGGHVDRTDELLPRFMAAVREILEEAGSRRRPDSVVMFTDRQTTRDKRRLRRAMRRWKQGKAWKL